MCMYVQDMKFLWSNLCLGRTIPQTTMTTQDATGQTIHDCIGSFDKGANKVISDLLVNWSTLVVKIGPWGRQLIWHFRGYQCENLIKWVDTRGTCSMSSHTQWQMRLGVSIFGMYVSQKVQNVILFKIHNLRILLADA